MNTHTETITEVDPRTGRKTTTTRTVTSSSTGDFGDDHDFFKSKFGDKFGGQDFTEEFNDGNGSTKKTTKYVTVNQNDIGQNDMEEMMRKFGGNNNNSSPNKKSNTKSNNNDFGNMGNFGGSSNSNNNHSGNFGGSSNSNKKPFELKTFRDNCLKEHNVHRRNHQVSDLKINEELNNIAQKYSEKLAATNSFGHSGAKFKGDNMGENLYMQGGRAMLGEMPADSWYDEIKDYNFNNPKFHHFK